MFYVCVICMVSCKTPLQSLTGQHRQIWERILSPRINITKLRRCLLLVCSECKQLLDTILQFRSTMNIGAKNLLNLYHANLKLTGVTVEPELRPFVELPQIISELPDMLLPVVNEEVVHSTESWDTVTDIEPARPVPTKVKVIKLPRILQRRRQILLSCSPFKNFSSLVHAPDHNDEYAVLIPNNEKTPDLQCQGDVVHSSEISETSKIEEAMPMPKDVKEEIDNVVFSNINGSSENKIKLNRQLFEAIRATLQSPSLKQEFDIKYEPESGPELVCDSEPELRRESRPDKGRESRPDKGRVPKPGLRESWPELGRESKLDLGRDLRLELGCESKPELERVSRPEVGRESKPDLGRNLRLELGCQSKPELERVSRPEVGRESEPDSESTLSCQTDYEDPENDPNIRMGCESEPDLRHQSDPGSESTLSCQSDYEDPESVPNIIFARAFNEISGKESPQIIEKELEGEGRPDDVQIHSHLVSSNPPSEWPCTWEDCELQSLKDEDENLKSPTGTPLNKQVTRSKRKGYASRRAKCNICSKSFNKISTLWIHYKREHAAPSVKCNLCRKECRNDKELKIHRIKDHIESEIESLTCAECGVCTLRPSALRVHLRTKRHAAVVLWRTTAACLLVRRCTRSADGRRVHTPHSAHSEIESLTCAECGVCTLRPSALRVHLRTKRHAAVVLWRFQCDICKRKFPDKEQISGHIQREHYLYIAKKAAKCPMCTATFRSARSLRRHATVHILAQAQETMHTNTQANGQARKRSRTTLTNAEYESTNGFKDTKGEEQETQTKTRKTGSAHTDKKRQPNEQDKHTEIQTNGQRNTTDDSQMRMYSNIPDHTYTYVTGPEGTPKRTRLNGKTHTNTQGSTRAEIQINTDSNRVTRITKGRRKRRRRRPLTTRKRGGAPAPGGQAPPVPKISLFDMLSSFIL